MWRASQTNISMAEGDYGIQLPVMVSGIEFTGNDVLKFVFKDSKNGTIIIVKDYIPLENAAQLEFTEAESALFPVGRYVYSLDWYQDGNFMCNIIPLASFEVVDKA